MNLMDGQHMELEAESSRDYIFRFRANKEERDFIMKKFELSGCRTISGYLRMVAITAHIIRYTGDDIKGIRQDFHGAANNINQIARRVNATGVLYPDDFKEVKEKIDDIWRRLIYIQSCLRLSKQ